MEVPSIGSSIGVLALIFIFRFMITSEYTFYYVYFNEIYPTQVRVIGTSLITVFGAATITIVPEIIDVCLSNNFPIMAVFAVLSVGSILLSWRLPETLNIPPPDIIE